MTASLAPADVPGRRLDGHAVLPARPSRPRPGGAPARSGGGSSGPKRSGSAAGRGRPPAGRGDRPPGRGPTRGPGRGRYEAPARPLTAAERRAAEVRRDARSPYAPRSRCRAAADRGAQHRALGARRSGRRRRAERGRGGNGERSVRAVPSGRSARRSTPTSPPRSSPWPPTAPSPTGRPGSPKPGTRSSATTSRRRGASSRHSAHHSRRRRRPRGGRARRLPPRPLARRSPRAGDGAALTPNVACLPVLADSYRALRRWNDVERVWLEVREASPNQDVMAEARIVAAGAQADRGDLAGALRTMDGCAPTPSGSATITCAVVRARRPQRPRRQPDRGCPVVPPSTPTTRVRRRPARLRTLGRALTSPGGEPSERAGRRPTMPASVAP